ncbi:hypothetical protein [Winogradskyella immobilis]|uniref:DUF1700 domain-containing protein n=1 Tax=Winogradskyella immobilis TaxID=2816852 RepID=A0ABS8EMH6_9FLAO|nr:hypothetical protein [Winogradskyella immobilis]MCC1483507.1 hypothetical protein [Winogradskyella immobilis]MCG0015601.1 hypothetical protein [Winogradskyella immobilis]
MKLTKEEIKFIDHFILDQNIKYLDIRSELIDHLATEFEENSNFDLIEDYLKTKVSFVKTFAKKQQKIIHWSYQKKLWFQFAEFFYKPKFIILLLGLIFSGNLLLRFFTIKQFSSIFFFTLIALILYPLFYQIKYSKAVKRVQSMQSLFTINSLPSVFLYSFSAFKDALYENYLLLALYALFSILLGLSAVIIVEKNRKTILGKYDQLVGEE